MRMRRLEVEGFGPFRARQTVDFDDFADDRLFLISGRTGAGKSSVLDAIVFALYGSVPRYEGMASRSVRSDHSTPEEPSRVRLEFEAEGRVYRVTRTPEYERPKRRGEGFTVEKSTALLEVLEEGAAEDGGADGAAPRRWRGLAARDADVGAELSRILPLRREQFLQVVLLAQNRFQEFLLAKSGDRQGVLRALFRTQRFEALARILDDDRKEAERRAQEVAAELEATAGEVARMVSETAPAGAFGGAERGRSAEAGEGGAEEAGLEGEASSQAGGDAARSGPEPGAEATPEWFEAARDRVRDLAEEAADEAGAARAARDAARAEAQRVRDLGARQRRRDAARAALAAAEAERATVEAARRELARARSADATADATVALDAAEAGERAALGEARTARRALEAAVSEAFDAAGAAATATTPASGAPEGRAEPGAPAGSSADSAPRAPGQGDDRARPTPADAATAAEIARAFAALDPRDRADAEEAAGDGSEGPALDEAALDEAVRGALAERDRLAALTGALDEAAAAGEELARRRALVDRIGQRRALLERRRAEAAAQHDDLERRLAELADEQAEARERAAGAEEAAAALARAATARDAAQRAALLAAREAEAVAAQADAAQEHTSAARAEAALVRARLDGAAVLLAAQLREGEPCAVCGALEHPAPASGDGAAVPSDRDVELAARRTAERRRALDEAGGELARIRVELASARAVAGAGSLDERAAVVAGAERRVRETTEAARRLERLADERARIERDRDEAAAERERLADELRSAADELAAEQAAATALAERIDRHRAGCASVAERRERVAAVRDGLDRLAAAWRLAEERGAGRRAAGDALEAALRRNGFRTRGEARDSARSAQRQAGLEALVRAHEDAVAAAAAALATPELASAPEEPVDEAWAVERAEEADAVLAARIEARARLTSAAARLDELATVGAALAQRAAAEARTAHELAVLAGTLSGREPNEKRMSLEAYVLAARLEEIVTAANARLHRMSGGRYLLQHDDSLGHRRARSGLGLRILDAYTGRDRATSSLSGGETFLASLALALGLADTVTGRAGGIRLDTLFIDEGFGSLDAETLGIAMATLDELRAGGRTVGVISHVEAMQEQIPAKLEVHTTDRGDSVITTRV